VHVRTALLLGVAILLAGVVAMVFILSYEPDPVAVAEREAPAPAAAPPEGAASPAARGPADARASAPDAPEPAPPEPPPNASLPLAAQPRTPASRPWEEVPLAARLHNLGPLASAMKAGLDEARDLVSHCFAEEASREPEAEPAGPGPGGPGALVLRLETRERAVEVVDAEVDALGTSSRALADCVRNSVRGLAFPAPPASPGERYRLLLPLL
jgi:hypothetical protein